MEIITKVISVEIIKPSSPTPKSLQKHQLSVLDQGMQPIYIPFVHASTTKAAAGDGGAEIVQKIREAMNATRVSRKVSKERLIEMVDPFAFSSLCGSPLYEADFGWGKPVWVGFGQLPVKNVAYLFDTKSGGGIEAYILLTKQDMEKFEPHFKLQMLKSNL